MLTPFRAMTFIHAAACLTLLASMSPPPVRAQETAAHAAPADSTNTSLSLSQARGLIKTGDYDGAIELLRGTIDQSRDRYDALRSAYLLLAKTYVYMGNENKFKPQHREMSRLNYKTARDVIAECLSLEPLRHTRAEPVEDFPEEMITLVAEVRGEIFGSFRVKELKPPGAIVLLGRDTLRAMPEDNLLGDVDLAAGSHRVVIHAEGFKDLTESITISPGSTLERSYHLLKQRGKTWYGTVGTGAAGVVAGVVWLVSRGGTPPAALKPLPEAPAPPP